MHKTTMQYFLPNVAFKLLSTGDNVELLQKMKLSCHLDNMLLSTEDSIIWLSTLPVIALC